MVKWTWNSVVLALLYHRMVSFTVEGSRRPVFCWLNYNPECGSDGNTYWNECVFNRHNCDKVTTIAHHGRCREKCPLYCVALYRPVCGTNGQSYWNSCELRRQTCNQKELSVSIAYHGNCIGGNNDCPSVCLALYSPVCGTDGKTYWNECELKRHNCKANLFGTQVSVAYKGRCTIFTGTETTTPDCDIVCTTIYSPVCGIDGKTYSNECALRANNCKQGTNVGISRDGRCEDATITRKPVTDCDIICTTIYSPVCGTDGITYSNECSLKASNCRQGTNVGTARDGRCEDVATTQKPVTDCDIICTTIYSPVCGTDGTTYSNECSLNASNCRESTSVGIARNGRCEDVDVPGGLGPTLAADVGVQTLVTSVRRQVEAASGRTFSDFTVVSYRTQVVSGVNYFVKVKVGLQSFIHVRVYEPLFGQGVTELDGYQENKTENESIEFF